MRITAQAKEETRARILACAERRFVKTGFGSTSTRDLARDAGIAAGTLFNYFPSKEALAMTLVATALERAYAAYAERRRGDLREELFAHVASGLRELAPYRAFVGDVIETALSPFSRSSVTEQGDEVRVQHLESVAEILARHGRAGAQGFVSIHLYWTLYLGVLAFWTRDDSPHQEDSLVVLDESLKLFVRSIDDAQDTETNDGNENR